MPAIDTYSWAKPNMLVKCVGHDGCEFYKVGETYVVFGNSGSLNLTPLVSAARMDMESWSAWRGLSGFWEPLEQEIPKAIREKLSMEDPFEVGDIVFIDRNYPGPLKVMRVSRREVLLQDDSGSQSWDMTSRVYREPFNYRFDIISLRKPRPWSWGAVVVDDRSYEDEEGWSTYTHDTPCEDPVLKSLGLTMGVYHWYNEDLEYYMWGQDKNLRRWFVDNVWHTIYEKAVADFEEKNGRTYENRVELAEYLPCDYLTFVTRLQVMLPTRSAVTPGHISIFESVEKMKQNRKTSMKPGRAVRKIFPEVDDASLEKIVDRFRLDYPNHNYEVVVSKEKDDFELAYNGKMAAYQNIYTTRGRKSLANSCMRGGGSKDWDHLECHPGATYASGDFTIIYARVKNSVGEYLIGGRCVVATCFDPPRHAPMYGVDEASMDVMGRELEKMGAVNGENTGWGGAKMLRVPHNGSDEDFVLPYLDIGPCSVDSETFTICSGGDLDCTDYSGVISTRTSHCCHCGDYVHPDDAMYDGNDNTWCGYCFHEEHFYCDHYGEYCHNETRNTVHFMRRGGFYQDTIDVCDAALSCREYTYCEHINEWWKTEDTVRLADGEYTSKPDADENCSVCHITDEWNYTDDMILVKNEHGDEVYVLEDALDGNDDYEEVSNKIYLYAHVFLNETNEEEVA